jgi:hypothetical protein
MGQGGIGMYSEAGPPPQDPRSVLLRDRIPTLTGPPGLRLADSNNPSGSYHGTDLVPPVRFPLTGQPDINQQENFEQAWLKDNGQ